MAERKMSEILKEMAELLLRDPRAEPSSEAMHAALLLANVAWNKSLGLVNLAEGYRPVLEVFAAENPRFWDELKSRDTEEMIDELVRFKAAHHPGDGRRIVACGIPEGKVRVEWIVPARPGEDPGWDMEFFGLIRTGEVKKAIRFAKKTWKLTEPEATSRALNAAIGMGLKPDLPALSRVAKPRAGSAKKAPARVTKSDFLRKALSKNPDLEHGELNKRWMKAGHPGEISQGLYYQIRSQLGIRSQWGWVREPDPAPPRGRRTAAPASKSRAATRSRKSVPASEVYQFKITLLDSDPTIWRRIQVADCTLDKLHEHIQTAMGWTNSHLHHFRIGEQLYGDPRLVGGDFDDMDYEDSTTTLLSEILPKSGQRFAFGYEYDFGDGWQHEILFEGKLRADPGATYPLCVEGERACPPEDIGGVWGYAEFVEAIKEPDHERHDELLEWVGGSFKPEKFHAGLASSRMRRGLPDWRNC
jgi:hypothetical protein